MIAYYVTTKNKLNVQDYGYGPPRWFGSRDIRVNQYSEGTLMVDFIDAKNEPGDLARPRKRTLELKGVDKKINKSTEKLMKQLPKRHEKLVHKRHKKHSEAAFSDDRSSY